MAGRDKLLKDGPGDGIVLDADDPAQAQPNGLQAPRGLVHGMAPQAWNEARSLTHLQLNDPPYRHAPSRRGILGQHDPQGGIRILVRRRDENAKVQRLNHPRGFGHGFPDQARHGRMRPEIDIPLGGRHDHRRGDAHDGDDGDRGRPPPRTPMRQHPADRRPAGRREHSRRRFRMSHADLAPDPA